MVVTVCLLLVIVSTSSNIALSSLASEVTYHKNGLIPTNLYTVTVVPVTADVQHGISVKILQSSVNVERVLMEQ